MRRLLIRLILGLCLLAGGYFGCAALVLAGLRVVDPPLTTVQVQRWLEGTRAPDGAGRRYLPVPLREISDHLEHAVIAAEDGRFFQHRGLDWVEIRRAFDETHRRRRRGASTITQQLVKNLFLTTHRSALRKALEVPLALLAELLLPKRRILELYLNVVEWGPAVYGAEAAAGYHYGTSAATLDRERAARLAACLPSPRTRRPHRMHRLSAGILRRMAEMGW